VSVDAADWGAEPPPGEWLALVNRQSIAVRLLSTTVHDVNNILQVMSGAAEVLALDPTPAAVTRRTTTIVGQSVAATAVLHGLTAFVRADTHARDGARPLAIAQAAVAARQHAIRKARLTVTVDGDDVDCAIASHRLQQIVLNLLLNAEQALAGHVNGRIDVCVAGADPVTFVVSDNGPGIAPDRAASLFSWPPRPHPAGGALGLGLLVSRQLVHEVGGSLQVEAAPAGGTVCTVTLPARR
jgi:signal transduction histidine kinase